MGGGRGPPPEHLPGRLAQAGPAAAGARLGAAVAAGRGHQRGAGRPPHDRAAAAVVPPVPGRGRRAGPRRPGGRARRRPAAHGRAAGRRRGLPRNEREAPALCVWSGVSYADAAAVLGIAEGSVRARVSKAKARLTRRLGPAPVVAVPAMSLEDR
ncbi:RNA polymerase sigma factor [Saccharothrix sp. BKS2]|uniref:RNA polymerase sigma factor n=1 Tax=Saccharothrix sp. BKS2 TaxID=3064400 RepID=UPI0039E85F8A